MLLSQRNFRFSVQFGSMGKLGKVYPIMGSSRSNLLLFSCQSRTLPIIVKTVEHLQLTILREQVCSSMGNVRKFMWHLAVRVALK